MSYEQCIAAVEAAVAVDERGDADAAVAAYSTAVEAIMRWSRQEARADRKQKLNRHAEECLTRAEQLKKDSKRAAAVKTSTALAKAASVLEKAGKRTDAQQKYLDAAQLLVDYTRSDAGRREDKAVGQVLQTKITEYLGCAELLATLSAGPAVPRHSLPNPRAPSVTAQQRHVDSAGPSPPPPPEAADEAVVQPMDDSRRGGGQGGGYHRATAQQYNKMSPAEEAFLKQKACMVYGSKLPLWDDPKEGYPAYHGVLHNQRPKGLFTDPRPPALSGRQKEHNAEWMRPKEFLPPGTTPRICTDPINPFDVMQSVVGNCSYVCSLTVAAHYERRFPSKRVITAAIFPQDQRGRPVVSPSGLYAVKLLINGAVRVVLIDDRIPVAKGVAWVGGPAGGHSVATAGHSPLCGHSASGDLWVSLYEKAFLKVFGASYDFGGSSSSADLYHLCGWIPESVDLDKDKTDKDAEWNRLHSAHHKGLIMVTVATPPKDRMPQEWRDKLGLIAGHAYSVIDFVAHGAVRLVKIMNPWRSQRWMGRYSHQDKKNWTPELVQHFKYDRNAEDNGVFWMDWNDAITFFDRLHISWIPHTFPYKFAVHADAPNHIPENNHYFRCQQYVLSVVSPQRTAIWVLLNRHLPPSRAQGKSASDDDDPFITLHVFATTFLPGVKTLRIGQAHTIGKARWLENGVYRNAAHKLVKIKVPPAPHAQHYHIIVSSLKPCPLPHSLYLFSPVKEVSLATVPAQPYDHAKVVKGSWAKVVPRKVGPPTTSAGGRLGAKNWRFNPQFRFEVREACHVVLTLEVAKETNIGMSLSSVGAETLQQQQGRAWSGRVHTIQTVCRKSGSYGPSFAMINTMLPEPTEGDGPQHGELPPQPTPPEPLAPGTYTVVPCTYDAGFEANFKLTLFAGLPSVAQSFAEVPAEGAGMVHTQLTGSWATAGTDPSGRTRTVSFPLYNFNEFTARVTATGDSIVTASVKFDGTPAQAQGVYEYLVPYQKLPRTPTHAAPAVLTVAIPAAQTGSFVVDCYANATVQVAR